MYNSLDLGIYCYYFNENRSINNHNNQIYKPVLNSNASQCYTASPKNNREHLRKYIYPKQDPEAPLFTDLRSKKEKHMSILRVLSQVLNKQQLGMNFANGI